MILQYFLSEILSVSFTVDLLQIIQQKYPGIICPFWNLSFTALQAQLDNLHSAMICDFLSGYISILTVSIATTMIKQYPIRKFFFQKVFIDNSMEEVRFVHIRTKAKVTSLLHKFIENPI